MKAGKSRSAGRGKFGAVARREKFVAGRWDWQQFAASRDQLQRVGKLVESAESVARAANKERGRAELWKMRGAWLVGALRRVQRVGQQEKRVDQIRTGGGEDRGLATAVRMAPQKGAARSEFPQRLDSMAKAALIAFGAVARRPGGTVLAKRKINAQNDKAPVAERIGHRDKERCLAV